ncbi:MAG: hypothetical protein PVI26_13675 [Chitinispirillia bacterium]
MAYIKSKYLFIFLCLASFLEAKEKLIKLDTRNLKIDHFDVRVEEVRRDKNVSIVKIKRSNGPSGDESLFVIRTLCLIAEAREMRFFIILREGEDRNGKYTYTVGYLNEQIQNLNGHFGFTANRPVTDKELMDSKDLMAMFGW